MQPRNKLSPNKALLFASASLSALVAVTSCGIDDKHQYPDKRFGQTPSDDAEWGDSESQPADVPNQTLLHQGFSGYFDLNSVRAVYFGSDPHNGDVSPGGGMVDSAISTALSFMLKEDSKESLEMLVTQQSKSLKAVTQTVQTDGGDALSNFKGEDSQSGSQHLDWAVETSSDGVTPCPKPFVCIKRMVWKPKSGKTFSYCYRDYETKKLMSIPYSANSNFTRQAYEAAVGKEYISRPFEVTSHPGDVSCDDPDKITQDVNQVSYRLSLGDLQTQNDANFIRKAKQKPLQADTEVVIEYRLHDVTRNQPYFPKKGPFIDQKTRLNSKIKFFTNTKEHVVVKIERTVTSPFKFGTSSTVQFLRDAYGETIGDSAAALFGPENDIEGIQVNYAFEFCTHLSVVKNPFNHCTGNTAP